MAKGNIISAISKTKDIPENIIETIEHYFAEDLEEESYEKKNRIFDQTWSNATKEQKEGIEALLINLTGYSLESLSDRADNVEHYEDDEDEEDSN